MSVLRAATEFSEAWLTRHPVRDTAVREAWRQRLKTLSAPDAEPGTPLASAIGELQRGVQALVGTSLRRGGRASRGVSVELAVGAPEAFVLTVFAEGIRLIASDGAGVLYGVFRLLELIARGVPPTPQSVSEAPHRPLRMLDHWDNLDGTIERGYAGHSLFFARGKVRAPSLRTAFYAKLCASVGLNAVAVNNVNVHEAETRLITAAHLPRLAQLAAVFRTWGIRLYLSVNFASPLTLGELDTADPLDARVAAWWQERARAVWAAIPDFGGFVVKADSEGRPGPFSYGRDHADGANLLARAVAPFGGHILWRCFVYNHHQDWRDRTTDRAKAAYEHFLPLDGRFFPNVLLQVKNGPMDFQPREPVSPLLGAMKKTRRVLELQITQEYLGQQRHLCFLPEQWRTYLDFPEQTPLSDSIDGMVAVANTGDDENWTGHDLAQANWYGFGRLAWNPGLRPESLAREWAELTFAEPRAAEAVTALLLGSWQTYEAYTAPLGVGWFVNPGHHYGPNPDGYEYDRWGTYHFADRCGLGVDRTAAGSGYVQQYCQDDSERFADLARCPDELLLFFHHVPYSHVLHSGKTVIQHIYDSHFEGAERAAALAARWNALRDVVPADVFQRVQKRLAEQKKHAALWRDVINTYFWRKSGVPDQQGRSIVP